MSEPRKSTATSEGRTADGRFATGNPGRPPGTRSRVTRAAEELLAGDVERITSKAVEMALSGDPTALRICMDRLIPPRKDTPVQFELPSIKTAEQIASAASSVLQEVSNGNLTPLEGAAVMALLDSLRRTLEISDIEARILALERES